ncbi:MAG: universal stress protein [Gammaproteobacteria bacterium]|nr:MAG: universal stress protein [Gammaproteobacteria bacterium]
MQSYRHILLAVDFSNADRLVVERATNLAKQSQAEISVIHVVDNLPISEPGYDVLNSLDLELTEVLIDKAKKQLSALAEELSVPEQRCHLQMGRAISEITTLAEEREVDLIVIGSHGRHGLGLLLGSTANGVLHHAKCDVLAVRVYDD